MCVSGNERTILTAFLARDVYCDVMSMVVGTVSDECGKHANSRVHVTQTPSLTRGTLKLQARRPGRKVTLPTQQSHYSLGPAHDSALSCTTWSSAQSTCTSARRLRRCLCLRHRGALQPRKPRRRDELWMGLCSAHNAGRAPPGFV
jgi:hypothetical protein